MEWNRHQLPDHIPALPENIDGYEQIARNLLAHGVFSSNIEWGETKELRPNLFRTPAYPIVLAILKYGFGELRAPIFIAHAAFGALTAVLTFWLARRFWGDRAGCWAGTLAACDPSSIIWAVYPRAEVLLTTLTVVGFCLLVAGGQRPERAAPRGGNVKSYLLLAGSGLAFALSALTKPIALYLPFVALPLLYGLCRKETDTKELGPNRDRPRARFVLRGWRAALAGGTIILAIWAALCGSWMIRNWVVTRHYSSNGNGMLVFSTIAPENLLAYRAAQVLALAEGRPLEKVVGQLRDKVHRSTGSPYRSIEHATNHLAADVAAYKSEAWRIIRDHPWEATRVQLQGMARLLGGPGELATLTLFGIALPFSSLNQLEQHGWEGSATAAELSDQEMQGHWIARVMVLTISWSWLIFFYAAALVGLVHVWRARQWFPLAVALIGIFYFAGLAGGPEANSRFRVPIIPYVSLLAGQGLNRWRQKLAGSEGNSSGDLSQRFQ